MCRVLDLAVNEYILDNRFQPSEILKFSGRIVEALNLVHFLSDDYMEAFTCCKIEGEYYVTVEDVDFTVKHRDLPVAFTLACLASVGLDKEKVDDLKFEYNFEKGIL